jgi:LCP family protein required for cell wall assembly
MNDQRLQINQRVMQTLNDNASRSTTSKLFPWLVTASTSVMLVGLFMINLMVQSFVGESDAKIASLVDEVGTLNQDNFMLSQEMESQQAVLKFIAEDFSVLQRTLEFAEEGDISAYEEMFTDFDLEEVELSSVEDDETLDILLLGNNGAHTDTIMIASINDAEEKITLFSVPRDLYINGRRINQYYHYYGVDQMKRMVEAVTGLKIDKYAQVDLDGFVAVVDAVEGIDIYVDEAIYDGTYPNKTGGYDPYSIDVGHYHMSGEEALKYARSRHSSSDFVRAERQQKILNSLRVKMLQMDSIMDMKKLTSLFKIGLDYTETDVALFDAVGYFYDYQKYDVHTGFVLTSGNYLYSLINESGAYILVPRTGNFDEIHGVIDELVN